MRTEPIKRNQPARVPFSRRPEGLRFTGRAGRAATRGPGNRGATLVELLIGLSLTAALLTATAFAMDASLKSYQINQEQASLVQRARMGVHRLLSAIREGEDHVPFTAARAGEFTGNGTLVEDTGIRMTDADGNAIVYRFDAANHRVMADAGGKSHVMIEGVESFTVRMEPMKSAAHVKAGLDFDLLRRATVLLTVRVDGTMPLPGEKVTNHTMTISSSAMPRRNAW
jgi:roadblock/LC7 domain-containing protein